MTFETETGSVYEVDLKHKHIRRLKGKHDPTPRQGEDGQWREYMDLTPVLPGVQVLITWAAVEEGENDIVLKSTLTSTVVKVDTGWVRDNANN